MIEMLERILDNLKWGETVLVEHSTYTPTSKLFHLILNWAKERGYLILIDDILDTLNVYKQHMKIAGLETKVLDESKVIKIRGIQKTGNIVGYISRSDIPVLNKRYQEIFENYFSRERVINCVLGYEKLLITSGSKEEVLHNLINQVMPFIGFEKRIAFYYIPTNVLEKAFPEALPLIESVSTTIIKLDKAGKNILFSIVKSIDNELDGIEIRI